jgi:hypothetical protein
MLSFLFMTALLPNLRAQNYVFEYDVEFHLNNSRRYFLNLHFTTTRRYTAEVSDFMMDRQQTHKRVTGKTLIPATNGPINQIDIWENRQLFLTIGGWTGDLSGGRWYRLYTNTANVNEFDIGTLDWDIFNRTGKSLATSTVMHKFLMYPELSINTSSTSSFLPFEDKVLVSGISGFTRAIYRWEYSTNSGNTWNTLPAHLINSSNPGTLRISASDLMSESEFLNLVGNNTNIQFRIYNPVKSSNIVTLPLRFTSPHIVGVSYEAESCHNSGDATATLTFERPLLPAEKLQIFVNGLVSQANADIVLDATNSYTVRGLESGIYNFSLLGSYNSHQTYTGDPSHSAQVNIPVRPALEHSFTKKDISCYDGEDGQITVSALGGTGQYSAELYENGNSSPLRTLQFTASSQAVFQRLSSGHYQVRVFDGNGCIAYAPNGNELIHAVELLQPLSPISAIVESLKNPLANGSSDGEALIRITGGTQITGGYLVTCTRSNGAAYPTGPLVRDGGDYLCTISNLPDGDYLLRIEDANYPSLDIVDGNPPCGCLFTVNFTLQQPEELKVIIKEDKPVSCNGENDGRLIAHGLGGIIHANGMTYTYTWYDASSGQPTEIVQQNDSILSDIPAGTYQVKITDANNIEAISGTYTLTQPNPLRVIVETKNVSCFDGEDGQVTISAEGGSGKYSASLFANGNSTALNTIEFSASSQGVLPGLKAGNYMVRVFDGNGCVPREPDGSESIHAVELIQPLSPVSATVELLKNPLANGSSDGEALIRITGGTQITAGYLVICTRSDGVAYPTGPLVRDGGDYLCTISDLPNGNYLLRIEDANYPSLDDEEKNPPCGCLFTVDFALRQPQKLEVTIEEDKPISCNGENDGRLIAHGLGGIIHANGTPYTYTWYDASSGQPTEIVQQNDSILSSIPAGTYQVKITDANNIEAISGIYTLTQPDSLRIIFETVDAGCAGSRGKVKAVVTGGTLPYSYQWNKEGETGEEITDVSAGDYIVRVTDRRGCILTASVEITAPGQLKVDTLITHPSCFNGNDGAIELTLNGATPPYTVKWKDNNSTETVRENLVAGIYEINVTDVNGCKSAYSFTLNEPEEMKVELNDDFTLCKDRSRTITAKCNQEEADYEWYKDGEKLLFTTAEITVDREGTYKVVATGKNGCSATDEIAVKMGEETLNVDFTVPSTVIPGSEIHAVNISTTAADKIVWVLPEEAAAIKLTDTEAIFRIDNRGTYTISMEGFKGDCSTILTKTITVAGDEDVSLPDDKNPLIKQFLVTPNPTGGAFKVLIELNKKEDFTMLLYSPAGILMDKKEAKQTQSAVFDYEIRGELSGAFMLHLVTRADRAAIKIVKEVKQ